MKGRIRREKILEILSESDADPGSLPSIGDSPKRVVNALLPLLYNQDDIIKWRAVTHIGLFVEALAKQDLESARNVVRRLMWNLNDESGGIGWGSPEAMGEILARHEALAGEYARILLSYADPNGNYLELPRLQQGLLWGIARLSEARPHLVKGSKNHFFHYLESNDPAVRGHAARIVGLIGTVKDRRHLLPLVKDASSYGTYMDHRCLKRLVGETAREAILKLETQCLESEERKEQNHA